MLDRLKAIEGLGDIQAEEVLNFLWKKLDIGVCFVGTDNHILAVNPTMAGWLGYPPSSLVGLEWSQITKGSDISEDLEAVASLMRGEIDDYRMEKSYRTREGGLLPAVLTVHAMRGDDGKRVVAFLSQIERADLPNPLPSDDWSVFFRIVGRYKKIVILSAIILTFVGTEIRSSIVNGFQWAFAQVASQSVESQP